MLFSFSSWLYSIPDANVNSRGHIFSHLPFLRCTWARLLLACQTFKFLWSNPQPAVYTIHVITLPSSMSPRNLRVITAGENQRLVYFTLFLFAVADIFLACYPSNLRSIPAGEQLCSVYFRYQEHFLLFLFPMSNFLQACYLRNFGDISAGEHLQHIYFRYRVHFLLSLSSASDFRSCIDIPKKSLNPEGGKMSIIHEYLR